jgi:hypothetical protein
MFLDEKGFVLKIVSNMKRRDKDIRESRILYTGSE